MHPGSGPCVPRVLNRALVIDGFGTCSIQRARSLLTTSHMSQFLPAIVWETILKRRNTNQLGSSDGGIASSCTQPPS